MEQKSVQMWSECYISGEVTACDPGRNTTTVYAKTYRREEISAGDNLTYYNQHLPRVKVVEIGEEYLVVNYFGGDHRVDIGGHLFTPRHPLDYAYSEVTIRIE